MRISTLRNEVGTALRDFAWDQWAQMGVLATTQRRDRWAADPEALLLFTVEVARDDPRLFDEVLDWLLVNERLISVQRLRNLARDDEDRALVGAALGWLARRRPRPRLTDKANRTARELPAEPLFRGTRTSIAQPDEAFLRYGLLKVAVEPSRKSNAPEIDAPINFAFRMRHLLGIGARAEVVRVLLCSDAPRLSAQAITDSAQYAKRNVQEALQSLRAARVVDSMTVTNEQRYAAPRQPWAGLLGMAIGELPTHRDWPHLLYALRHLSRWLADSRHEELSDYMLASEARLLMDKLAADLRFGGVAIPDSRAHGSEYWPDFVDVVHTALSALS